MSLGHIELLKCPLGTYIDLLLFTCLSFLSSRMISLVGADSPERKGRDVLNAARADGHSETATRSGLQQLLMETKCLELALDAKLSHGPTEGQVNERMANMEMLMLQGTKREEAVQTQLACIALQLAEVAK